MIWLINCCNPYQRAVTTQPEKKRRGTAKVGEHIESDLHNLTDHVDTMWCRRRDTTVAYPTDVRGLGNG
jgi:hypothetical protein